MYVYEKVSHISCSILIITASLEHSKSTCKPSKIISKELDATKKNTNFVTHTLVLNHKIKEKLG